MKKKNEQKVEKIEETIDFSEINFEELNYEESLDEEMYKFYKNDYETYIQMLDCFRTLTLNEYIWCQENDVDECKLVKYKNKDNEDFVCCSDIPIVFGYDYSGIIVSIVIIIVFIFALIYCRGIL